MSLSHRRKSVPAEGSWEGHLLSARGLRGAATGKKQCGRGSRLHLEQHPDGAPRDHGSSHGLWAQGCRARAASPDKGFLLPSQSLVFTRRPRGSVSEDGAQPFLPSSCGCLIIMVSLTGFRLSFRLVIALVGIDEACIYTIELGLPFVTV